MYIIACSITEVMEHTPKINEKIGIISNIINIIINNIKNIYFIYTG